MDTTGAADVLVERAAVCVLGAGIGGLNALAVATEYLGEGERAILVDKRDRPGGMWVSAYPYVRLHQPHRLFTAADIRWKPSRKPQHLASRLEVLDHFDHCLEEIKKRSDVSEYFGWEYESHEELEDLVRVTCRSSDGRTLIVETPRLVNAFGFQIPVNEPLAVSSKRVTSLSPDTSDLRGDEFRSDAPVWIVGGGKTGMDTAHALITEYPGREINLVAGKGTAFVNRDVFFPTGLRRWTGGRSFNRFSTEAALAYDGTNDLEYSAYWVKKAGLTVTPSFERMQLGLLSEAEARTIRDGLRQVRMDYFADVVDRSEGAVMTFHSGAAQVIPAGSIIVNCTGYLRRRELPYAPFISASGRVLTISNQSSVLVFSSFAGFLLTHAYFLGKLKELPLYELDSVTLNMRDPNAATAALAALTSYNMGVLMRALPARVFLRFGLDLDRYYPRARHALFAMRSLPAIRESRQHNRQSLDRIRTRFPDIRCGPLVDA